MAKITPRKRDKLMRSGLNKITARHARTAPLAEIRTTERCFAYFEAKRRLASLVSVGLNFRF